MGGLETRGARVGGVILIVHRISEMRRIVEPLLCFGRNMSARLKAEGAVHQHDGGDMFHERKTLDVEVAKHSIAVPASEKLQGLGGETRREECHSTAGAKAVAADVGGVKSQIILHRYGSGPHGLSNITGFNKLAPSTRRVDGVERRVRGSVVSPKVGNAAVQGTYGACQWVSRTAKQVFLVWDTALLVLEAHATGVSIGQGGHGVAQGVQPALAMVEEDIFQLERGAEGVVGALDILAGAAEKVETDEGEIRNSAAEVAIQESGRAVHSQEKGERNRFDPCRRGVFALPTFDELRDAELNYIGADKPFVTGPQAGHRLADAT